jgi:hypothetical protein
VADQKNRGGKKEGTGKQEDAQKQQGTHDPRGQGGPAPRPPAGQPGGPKQNEGKSRP